MALTPYLSGDASTPKAPGRDKSFSSIDSGPYVGIVKSNRDSARMGRLKVLIPSIHGDKQVKEDQLITCEYLSPFYGTKTTRYVDKSDPNKYKAGQHSYGMWFVPPDIDTKVLVIFAEGQVEQAYWIGCVQDAFINHMTPGIAASTNTGVEASANELGQQSKQALYGTDNVPSGEVNKLAQTRVDSKFTRSTISQPIHPFAETLRQEGLIQDTVRGTTSSSARRESPSQVYGISTPGRKDPSSPARPIGSEDSKVQDIVDRLTGHTFVMDDGDSAGDNQLIRLRSASGHQILLNDSAGVVYIANGSGNAWMEFAANGSIDIYSSGSVSMRSAGDMNFHSDANINMFARNQIKMSAVSKLVLDGATIQQHADFDIQLQATGGSITNKAPAGSVISYAGQQQIHMASGQHHLTGSQVHFNSISTNPNIVSTYERTSVLDAKGTGTKRELIPDVNITEKYKSGPLTVTQNGNVTMSGMRVPTHEPFPYHFDKIVNFVGGQPGLNDKIPGTPEFIAARNRASSNDTIRFGQFQADLQYQLEKQGLGQVQTAANKVTSAVKSTVGSISAIQKAADDFTKNYSLIYGLPQNTLSSITPLTTGVNEIVNQTIKSVTGDAVNLLKDQVFVNQSGILYTAGNIGQAVSGNITNVLGDLTSTTGVFNTAGNIINNAINIPGLGGTVNTLNNLSTVTDSYKNIVGGNITAVTSITSLVSNIGSSISSTIASVGRAIGNIFKW